MDPQKDYNYWMPRQIIGRSRQKQEMTILNKPVSTVVKKNSDLFNTNKVAYVDSVLNANKDKEWVRRLVQPQKTANSIQDPYESKYRSTHLMSDDGNGYVYPQVIKGKSGKLIHFPTALNMNDEDSQVEYAKKNNLGIQLPKEHGTWFAGNGYKIGTGVNNDIDSKTGIPQHDPNYKLPIQQTDSAYTTGGFFKRGIKKAIKDFSNEEYKDKENALDDKLTNAVIYPVSNIKELNDRRVDGIISERNTFLKYKKK